MTALRWPGWPRRCLRRLPLLLLLPGLLTAAGCLSFRSVVATASVGQMIGPRAAALGLLPVFCQAENILSRSATSAAPSCPQAEIDRHSQELTRYSQNVSAYAAMLRDIAEFDDNRVSDPLDRVVRGTQFFGELAQGNLDASPAASSVSAAAAKVTQVLTQEWRRNRIEELVRDTHPALDAVLQGLVERAAALGESMKFQAEQDLALRRRILDELDRETRPSEPTAAAIVRTQNQAMLLGLLHFQHFARRANEALLEYKKSVVAFRRAHQLLYERVSQNRSLFEDDSRVYEALKKDIPPLLK
jgi:hypothetical protein